MVPQRVLGSLSAFGASELVSACVVIVVFGGLLFFLFLRYVLALDLVCLGQRCSLASMVGFVNGMLLLSLPSLIIRFSFGERGALILGAVIASTWIGLTAAKRLSLGKHPDPRT